MTLDETVGTTHHHPVVSRVYDFSLVDPLSGRSLGGGWVKWRPVESKERTFYFYYFVRDDVAREHSWVTRPCPFRITSYSHVSGGEGDPRRSSVPVSQEDQMSRRFYLDRSSPEEFQWVDQPCPDADIREITIFSCCFEGTLLLEVFTIRKRCRVRRYVRGKSTLLGHVVQVW